MQTAWFTTKDWIARNKDVAKRFADVLVEAGDWGMKNHERAAQILSKAMRVQGGVQAHMRFASKSDPTLLQPVFDAAERYKMLPHVNAREIIWEAT
jgi:ABC-type nitrate/sulfonate/bicarbonate transport system substrate-binding protein